jgi:FtsP/CotA-like multicopper oxidase with cupredoxin domain
VSDNVFLKPAPAQSVNYVLNVPENQPGGMYWYHPHMHGLAQEQVDRGLAGAIVVEGGHKLNPAFKAMRQRVMLFQWVQYDPTTGNVNPDPLAFTQPYDTMINGVKQPIMKMHPGESQYWHIGNAAGTVWYIVRLDGFDITVIAEDGNPLAQPKHVDQLEFSPAKRFEVVVTAKKAGSYTLNTLGKNVDGVFSWKPETLADVIVEGETVPTLPAPQYVGGDDDSRQHDLRKATLAHTRTVTFTQQLPGPAGGPPPGGIPPGGITGGGTGIPPGGLPPPGGPTSFNRSDFKFFIDGLLYDENYVNTTVGVNTVEEWTVINDSDDAHAFHVHVNPFEVIAVDGRALDTPYWADTAIINGHPSTPVPHSITFRTRFADYGGRYVYHCHNLFHEDQGMMAVIDVVARADR